MRPNEPRDPVAGPDAGPAQPYPIRLSGPVIKGFGRGSKELGIPTANIPAEGLSAYPDLQSGVYYGVTALNPKGFDSGDPSTAESNKSEPTIFPCVLSIGYNPFYKNTVRSVEIHVLPHLSLQSSPSPAPSTPNPDATDAGKPAHHRPHFHYFPDFYGTHLNLLILGYIRPEYDYVSLEALVEDIRIDCDVARRSLARKGYEIFMCDNDGDDAEAKEQKAWLRTFSKSE